MIKSSNFKESSQKILHQHMAQSGTFSTCEDESHGKKILLLFLSPLIELHNYGRNLGHSPLVKMNLMAKKSSCSFSLLSLNYTIMGAIWDILHLWRWISWQKNPPGLSLSSHWTTQLWVQSGTFSTCEDESHGKKILLLFLSSSLVKGFQWSYLSKSIVID